MNGAAGRAAAVLAAAALVLAAVAGIRWARHGLLGAPATAPLLADGAATLLVVLRTSDCGTYRPLMSAWDRLHREGGPPVVGTVIDAPETGAVRDSLADRLGVAFPLRFDDVGPAEDLALSLGYGLTPVSVLLDRAGRARTVVPPVSDPARVEAAARIVRLHHRHLVRLQREQLARREAAS